MPEPRRSFAYGAYALASDLPLPAPELPGAMAAGRRTLAVEVAEALREEPPPGAWIHDWVEEDGSTSLSLARTGAGLLLRFPGEADFVLDRAGSRLTIHPASGGCDDGTLAHLLLDQVLPRVLAHHGLLVLHAAAVASPGGTILLVGGSGAGKSTLAAALHARGLDVVSDDAVVLDMTGERARAVPTYPGLRLHPDALAVLPIGTPAGEAMARYSDKRRIPVPSPALGSGGVLAIFVLEPTSSAGTPGAPTVVRLPPSEACMALIRNSFQMEVSDHRRQEEHLALAASVADQVPVRLLSHPREFGALPTVCATVLRWARGG